MLNDCQRYAVAINAKETPFPTEPLIMGLLLAQHKMIGWLSEKIKPDKNKQVRNIKSRRNTQCNIHQVESEPAVLRLEELSEAAGRSNNIHGSGS
jgi:hypothetical protein